MSSPDVSKWISRRRGAQVIRVRDHLSIRAVWGEALELPLLVSELGGLQVFWLNWQTPNALARRGKDGVGHRWHDNRIGHFTNAGR